jgi:hypothetical protein
LSNGRTEEIPGPTAGLTCYPIRWCSATLNGVGVFGGHNHAFILNSSVDDGIPR